MNNAFCSIYFNYSLRLFRVFTFHLFSAKVQNYFCLCRFLVIKNRGFCFSILQTAEERNQKWNRKINYKSLIY